MNNKKEYKKGENFLKNRKDIKDIEKEIISGKSLRQISSKFDCSYSALSRYKNKYLMKKLNVAQANRNLKDGENLLDLLEQHLSNIVKLSNACMEQLKDPDNPNKLFLGARADDITVSYMDYSTDETGIKAKEKLQVLVNRVLAEKQKVTHIDINTTDRAHTLIAASNALNKHVHLFAELAGKLGNTTINITNQPVFIELTKVVIELLSEYPGAREKLAEKMRMLQIEENTE